MARAQHASDLLQQAIMARKRQVSHLDRRRIAPAGGGAAGNDRDRPLAALGDQHAFPGGTIESIEHVIEPRLQNPWALDLRKNA